MISSYRNLYVWQKGMNFCEEIYLVTKNFPKSEMYGLISQIRRSCISIPSNIAEGNARGSRAEYKQFLRIAFASAAELETQLMLSERIGYLKKKEFEILSTQLEEIIKMLNSLIRSI